MFSKKKFGNRPTSEDKRLFYKLVSHKETEKLKEIFSSNEFYFLSKHHVFRFIHLCANAYDPYFRNEMVDFLIANKNYIAFAKKHIKGFSSALEN